MEEERSEVDKMEEVILPGFRFHPTDEELVGFYLKRKIEQRPLSIELIKQLDIYKYDPWDLPKLARSGEKEWYFYCPRDRKYRNSARPNRVTGGGFWKATGTDRPIYSTNGINKCIGLKKSLVFYKGRASKATKTDWMMHEFRLPSLTDNHHSSAKRSFFHNTTIPPNDSWAICRIFMKTNSTAQRALSQSWVSTTKPTAHELGSLPTTTEAQLNNNYTSPSPDLSYPYKHHPSNNNPLMLPTKLSQQYLPNIPNLDSNGNNFMFSPLLDTIAPSRCTTLDVSSMLLNMSSSMLGDFGQPQIDSCNNNAFLLSNLLPQIVNNGGGEENMIQMKHIDDQWNSIGDDPNNIYFKPNLVDWDFSSQSLPTDHQISTNFATAQCYT